MSVHAGLNGTFGYFEVTAALDGRLPLEALLDSTSAASARAGSASPTVRIDNAASKSYSVIEVRAPDQVGLLYRTARALSDFGLEIHHAKISTHPHGGWTCSTSGTSRATNWTIGAPIRWRAS